MIHLPIIFREARVAARKKRTFVFRFLFGGVLALAVGLFLLIHAFSRGSQAVGLSLLRSFSWQITLLVCLLAPALSAGCIADEKRQGTLGLLFLTRLNAADIVLGKFVAKGLDVLLLVMSATPLLFVPVLLGGVGWKETITMVLTILSVLLMTLSVGVFVSSIARSTMMAATFAYIGLIFYNVVVVVLPHLQDLPFSQRKLAWLKLIPGWIDLASPFVVLADLRLQNALISIAFNGGLAVLLLSFCIWRLPRMLRQTDFREPLGRTLARWLAPALRIIDRRRRRRRSRLGNGNPAFWLYFGRNRLRWLVQGLTVLGLAAWLLWAFIHEPTRFHNEEWRMGFYVIGMIGTFCLKFLILLYVARSFVLEKENGSLEMLLTTPATNRQIVHGKLRAVLGHYGLFFGIVYGLMAVGGLGHGTMRTTQFFSPNQLVTTASGIIAVVLVSMLISLWSKTVTQAVLFSILGVFLMSWVLGMIAAIAMLLVGVGVSLGDGNATALQWGVTAVRALIDLLFALVAYRLLISKLRVYATR